MAPGAGATVRLFGVRFTVKVVSDDSGATLAVMEVDIPAGTLMNPQPAPVFTAHRFRRCHLFSAAWMRHRRVGSVQASQRTAWRDPPRMLWLPTWPGRMGAVTGNAGADWAGYYAWSSGRDPRPMLLSACHRLGAGDGRLAVDLGCGEGTDALALLDRGWSVLAIDIEPGGLALLRARIPAARAGCIRIVCASFADAALPPAYLIHAGFSLPFCPPRRFLAVWAQIRRALVPGAIFAGQLFGTRDSWADDPGMTFHNRAQVISLLDGLEILELHESERDGEAYSGPKHWHTYDILARDPRRESAPAGHPSGA